MGTVSQSVANERLILQIGQGDRTALTLLFEQTCESVYCYALSMVRSDRAAREIVEKTYLSVWKDAGEYHVEMHDPLPWLLMLCRRQVKAAPNLRMSGKSNLYTERSDCPVMNQLLNGLPIVMRQIMVLKAVLEQDYHDIAFIAGTNVSTGYLHAHALIRLNRDDTVKRIPDIEGELRREAPKGIPAMSAAFLAKCDDLPQRRNRSGRILIRSHMQPVRLVVSGLLVMALTGTTWMIHTVNREHSEIMVSTESSLSMTVNGMNRVKSIVAEKDNREAGTDADGSTLAEVVTSVTNEELKDENLTPDNNSMLVTVLEDDTARAEKLQKETLQTIQDTAGEKGIDPVVLIQQIDEDTDAVTGKEALVQELKTVLEDCRDQSMEELPVQDLIYLYYHRGLDLDTVSLYGVPSEDKYQKGWEAASQIYEQLKEENTWADIFLTVWNNQLVYRVAAWQDGMRNIFEVNAESGDIIGVVIEDETQEPGETITETASASEESKNAQNAGASSVSDGSSAGVSLDEIDFSDINTWLNQGQKVIRSATSPGSASEKVSRIIRDATFGKVNLGN